MLQHVDEEVNSAVDPARRLSQLRETLHHAVTSAPRLAKKG
jgi:hypothetical protein